MKIFICYSHADEKFKEEFLKHISGLMRQGVISEWDDRLIDGGADWRTDILDAIATCEVALLFVSSDFLASDFINSVELSEIMKRESEKQISVVPVILRKCVWEKEIFSKLQAWPKNAKPIIEHAIDTGERDSAWTYVVEKLSDKAQLFKAGSEKASAESPPGLNSKHKWTFTFNTEAMKKVHISQLSEGIDNAVFSRRKLGSLEYFPFCLNPLYRKTESGVQKFDSGLIALAGNQYIKANFSFSPGKMIYMFNEFTNWDFNIVNARTPFLDLLYVLLLINKLCQDFKLDCETNVIIQLESVGDAYLSFSDDRTLLHPKHGMIDRYKLNENPLEIEFSSVAMTVDSLIDLFQRIIGSFASVESKSHHPYPIVTRDDISLLLESLNEQLYDY